MIKNEVQADYLVAKGESQAAARKQRITIRLDRDVLDWFRRQAKAQGGGSYQAMINLALREYVGERQPPLEDVVRRVVREELAMERFG